MPVFDKSTIELPDKKWVTQILIQDFSNYTNNPSKGSQPVISESNSYSDLFRIYFWENPFDRIISSFLPEAIPKEEREEFYNFLKAVKGLGETDINVFFEYPKLIKAFRECWNEILGNQALPSDENFHKDFVKAECEKISELFFEDETYLYRKIYREQNPDPKSWD